MEKIIIDVDAQDAERTIKDIRADLKAARAAFEGAAIGSDDFAEATKQMATVQSELRSALNASTLTLEQATAAVDLSGKSYRELSEEMGQLKKIWRETTDETARAAIGENINTINARLKEMDASIGNYQRNVGNYSSALDGFSDRLIALGDGIRSQGSAWGSFTNIFKSGIAKMGAAFKSFGAALAANPVGALVTIFGMLLPLIDGLVKKFSIGRESGEKMNVAMAALGAPLNVLSNGFELLIQGISKAAEWLVSFADKLGLIPQATKDAAAAAQAMADAENALRASGQDLAIVQAEMAELRARAKDDTLELSEREKALTVAHEAELKALKAEAKAAADMYEAMQKQAALSPTSKEDEEKLAQARIKAANAQRAVNDEVRAYNTQVARFHSAAINEERAAIEARNKAHAAYLAQIAQNKKDYKALIALQIANEREWSDEYMKLSRERIELERQEAIEAAANIKVKATRLSTIAALNERAKKQQEELLAGRKAYDAAIEASAAKLQSEADAAIAAMENEDFVAMEEALKRSIVAIADDVNIWAIWLDPDKASAEIDANRAKIEELKMQIEEFRAWEYESELAANEALAGLREDLARAEIKASNDATIAEIANKAKAAKATQEVLGKMSGALKSWGEESKAAQVAYKATASAETIMNTASGAMAAYKAMAGIPYVGPALGIAAAAAVVAEGAYQLKQINSADSGSVSSSGASASGAAGGASVESSASSTITATEAAYMDSYAAQKEQRVTIVASDIVKAYDDYKATEVVGG